MTLFCINMIYFDTLTWSAPRVDSAGLHVISQVLNICKPTSHSIAIFLVLAGISAHFIALPDTAKVRECYGHCQKLKNDHKLGHTGWIAFLVFPDCSLCTCLYAVFVFCYPPWGSGSAGLVMILAYTCALVAMGMPTVCHWVDATELVI